MELQNHSCHILISLLVAHGIKNIVLSPGSRNAPIIVAAARNPKLTKTVIVDERCAAFVALGMCKAANGKLPVALVCTSGTALLNYAPAIAEAYYHNLPLIVISADRPIEWIDQDDSQTMHQNEILTKFVKNSFNIPTICETRNQQWFVNRVVNDAILTSKKDKNGPIHINIQIDEPMHQYINNNCLSQRIISMPQISQMIGEEPFNGLVNDISTKKILIISGFQNCEDKFWGEDLNHKLNTILKQCPNIAMFSESLANIHCDSIIYNIDRVLSQIAIEEKIKLKPDIIITFGGAIVSRFIKQYLRKITDCQHWHIGVTDTTIDCFQKLTTRINIHPNDFFTQLYNSILNKSFKYNSYQAQWKEYADIAEYNHNKYLENCEWSDLKAFSIILPQLKGNLHLSNGTPIRYHQLFNHNKNIHHVYCNRGVSGIDGCTSTAIGYAMLSSKETILISGDLSAQYDIGALAIPNIPNTFKMIVINNGGGGIFKFIKSTSVLDEVDDYFVTKSNLPLSDLAKGFGFNFYSANNEESLSRVLPSFLEEATKPSILEITTQYDISANILTNYFKLNNKL